MPPLVNSIGRALLSLKPPAFGVQPFRLRYDHGLLRLYPGGFCFHIPLGFGHRLPQLRLLDVDRFLILCCHSGCYEPGDLRR